MVEPETVLIDNPLDFLVMLRAQLHELIEDESGVSCRIPFLSSEGLGSEEGGVGLEQNPSEGESGGGFLNRFRVLECHDSGESDHRSRESVDDRLGEFPVFREAVHDEVLNPRCLDSRNRFRFCVPGMDDDRKVVFQGDTGLHEE